MRYIAVFSLFAVPVAKGFASEEEATNCLEQAYTDSDSSPIGLYDAYRGVVTSYPDEKNTAGEENLTRRIAQAYIERTI